MGIMDKLEQAAGQLESAAADAAGRAKAKYDETMTPEKKAELKERSEKGMQNADERLTEVAETVGREIKDFVQGSGTGGENK